MVSSRSRFESSPINQSHNNITQWDEYCNQISDTINAFTNACTIDNKCAQDLHSVGGQTNCGQISQSVPAANRDEQNSHKKLGRQLSVNPNGCDARLFRRQNAIKQKPPITANQLQQQQQHHHQLLSPNLNSGHRPLAQALSGPRAHNTNHWELHKVN